MSRRAEKGQCATSAMDMSQRQLRTSSIRSFLISGETIAACFFAHMRLTQKEEPSLRRPTRGAVYLPVLLK